MVGMRNLLSVWCLAGLAAATPAFASDVPVDLQLVLAVDVSPSMDVDEQRIQRAGYVAAFRDPTVIQAITSGPLSRVAVAYLEWARPGFSVVAVPWSLIANTADADAFAARLAAAPRVSEIGTSISTGLLIASGLFASSGFTSPRREIDVSGDGPNNAGFPVNQTRDMLVRNGFVINGLPIMIKLVPADGDIPDLDAYYQDCVIGGPGSFVIRVQDASQFEEAIRRKLVQEISGLTPAVIPAAFVTTEPLTVRQPVDCQIGEKIRLRSLLKDR
jgi:Protein of unknown function (DUF1194)